MFGILLLIGVSISFGFLVLYGACCAAARADAEMEQLMAALERARKTGDAPVHAASQPSSYLTAARPPMEQHDGPGAHRAPQPMLLAWIRDRD